MNKKVLDQFDYSQATSALTLKAKRLNDALNEKDWQMARVYAQELMRDMQSVSEYCVLRIYGE
jgi:hypothetical protein